MGAALAEAALRRGHEVVIVSGPVEVAYPAEARVVHVNTTDEMLDACRREFPACDGLIGAAAPCDYRPERVEPHKIAKTGEPLRLHLVETGDVVATLGAEKSPGQWVVGFALETEDPRFRALVKLEKKRCDLIVLNGPEAMNSLENQVEILDKSGAVLESLAGSKQHVADGILDIIEQQLIARS
jgi:phosphopantothenoylcysteine decarboxylase/phosphopantothenate--cysteine ligase